MELASLVPFQGPKKSRFSGPTPSNAPRNDVAPLKTIMYRAIKTTGLLIVNMLSVCKTYSTKMVKDCFTLQANGNPHVTLYKRRLYEFSQLAVNFPLESVRAASACLHATPLLFCIGPMRKLKLVVNCRNFAIFFSLFGSKS